MRILIAILVLVGSYAHAQTKYFPYKIGPNGEVLAPFANPEADKKSGDPLADLYDPLGETLENSSSIDTPHRSKAQLARWAADIIVRATTLSERNASKALTDIKQMFTESGWQNYLKFLKDEAISTNLKTPGYQITSYSLQTPEMMTQGVLGGKYKWLYDVPISIETRTADGRFKKESINVVVQITRIEGKVGDEHDVKIETWKIERLQNDAAKSDSRG